MALNAGFHGRARLCIKRDAAASEHRESQDSPAELELLCHLLITHLRPTACPAGWGVYLYGRNQYSSESRREKASIPKGLCPPAQPRVATVCCLLSLPLG